jgi:hypothetical protein
MTSDSVSRMRGFVILAFLLGGVPAGAGAQEASTVIPLPATQYKLNRLAPGQPSGQAIFPLDQSGVVTVQIIANDGGLNTSVLGPSGQVINPATVEALGGEFSTTAGAANDSPLLAMMPATGFHYFYSFPSLGPGNYTVRFDRTSAGEVAVMSQVTTNSPIGAALIVTEPTLVLGNAAVLTAAIFDGTNAIAGASVAVTILPGSGPPVTLTLTDDGAAADDTPGDGLYSGEFVPVAIGNYRASAVITGASGGTGFTRHGATSFSVVPKNSALAGTFADQGVDDDGDGRFDRVSILVETVTTVEGRYRAFVHLRTAAGQHLVRSGEADLLISSHGVAVDFEASAFVELNENGPYRVDLIELLFVDSAGASPSDRRADLGQTRAYLLSEFQRPALMTTGVISDQGVDDNGNGKFDRLLVSVQVDVLVAGFYSWGFKVTDAQAREIEFGSGGAFLTPGLNQLAVTFEGVKIGAFGVDGPYHLRDLLVQGPGTSLVLTDIGRTHAYRFSQFEGAISNRAPVASAGDDQVVEATGANGASVRLDGSMSEDPDGDTLSYEWRDAAGNVVATVAQPNVVLPLGAHSLTLTVDDQRGGTASDTVLITIRDTTAPLISSVTASPNVLWAPNHKLVPVTLATVASDAVTAVPACQIGSVTSSEPPNGGGDGNTVADWLIVDNLSLHLRAERAGNGSGRVYTIVVRCRDIAGNVSTGSAEVTVPHDR